MPAATHSFDLPEPELTNVPSSPVRDTGDPNDGLAVEASGSTADCDRDSIDGVSKGNTKHGCDESDSESTANSGLSQQLGIASHAQTPRRQLSSLPTRSSAKWCGPLVASQIGHLEGGPAGTD